MARQKIKIMISSRCADKFPLDSSDQKPLSEIRAELKRVFEKETLLGRKIFDVWTNEDAPPEPGDNESLETCLNAVREADILLVLYNGNAGWSVDKTGNGICHDELLAGYSQSAGKVSLISIYDPTKKGAPSSALDKKFQTYVDRLNLFRGGNVTTLQELEKRAKESIRETALKLMHDGSKEAKKSAGDSGPALDWTRMNFSDRRDEMIKAVSSSLSSLTGATSDDTGIVATVNGSRILFVPHAIPSSFSVSPAREMVGQPFLKDHEKLSTLKNKTVGPVHIIACQKGITESQAMKLLGFPDATIVQSAFGVYVADNIQKIQICLIANCIDESSTHHNAQKFFQWLEKTGESELLANRAKSRFRIIKSIAEEIE